MKQKIRKILVANRGEIALRVMRTCKEMGISTVAIYSETDFSLPFVRFADEAFCVGKAKVSESYLEKEKIIDIALKSGADAIHPGYGFLSENPEFCEMVTDAGLIFIGPPASAIKKMGDKISARNLVKKASVPIVPGTEAPIASIEEAIVFSKNFGYPILLKAAGGGGGKGMRIVNSDSELNAAFRAAQSEAKSAFGDDRIYLEKYLNKPRHIEFQILIDQYGNGIHLGERECSIQRRHQKIIEESPSVVLNNEMRNKMGLAAIKAALSAGYINAGTIEFLVDAEKKFYFLEMNTRLQVEHPVTELVTHIDLVKEQINIASGLPIRFNQDQIVFRGHAIECRIYAEDSENNFLPSIGKIQKLIPPSGPFIREDRGVEEGNEISIYYDPMISKLLAWGEDRNQAIQRMTRALEEYLLVGVKTNINACKWIINHPKFVEGDFDTHFIQNYFGKYSNKKDDDLLNVLALSAVLVKTHQKEKANVMLNYDNQSKDSWKYKKYENYR